MSDTVKLKALDVIRNLPAGASWLLLIERLLAASEQHALQERRLTDRPCEPGATQH